MEKRNKKSVGQRRQTLRDGQQTEREGYWGLQKGPEDLEKVAKQKIGGRKKLNSCFDFI